MISGLLNTHTLFASSLFFHSFISMVFIAIINIIVIIILLQSILISFHWMSFSVNGAHISVVFFKFVFPFARGRALWLDCGYCWPGGWFHPTGAGLLANRTIVLGTWPPLATNVVNSNKLLDKPYLGKLPERINPITIWKSWEWNDPIGGLIACPLRANHTSLQLVVKGLPTATVPLSLVILDSNKIWFRELRLKKHR